MTWILGQTLTASFNELSKFCKEKIFAGSGKLFNKTLPKNDSPITKQFN